jgi:hypothetical protein
LVNLCWPVAYDSFTFIGTSDDTEKTTQQQSGKQPDQASKGNKEASDLQGSGDHKTADQLAKVSPENTLQKGSFL